MILLGCFLEIDLEVNKYGINLVYFGLMLGNSFGKIVVKIGIKYKMVCFLGFFDK